MHSRPENEIETIQPIRYTESSGAFACQLCDIFMRTDFAQTTASNLIVGTQT